jgi:predicted ATP-grasp superfamily ATP-dependent carboligase
MKPKNILITSSRMPPALDEIRKLGSQGHRIFASDTFRTAPGSHSKYVQSWRVTASPRHDTLRFIADVKDMVIEEKIELILPMFEEVFYIAKHLEVLTRHTDVFCPSFDTLARLHDKAKLLELARELDIPAPRTTLVSRDDDLKAAAREYGDYFARPAYGRGGVELLTNRGPLDGVLTLEDCHPSADNPWLVQEFVTGTDVCSFSIAHHGCVAAHSTYVHPRELEHAGGIVFESIVEPEGLHSAQKIVEATSYHGQISLDFLRTDRGLLLIECNPRPTPGVYVMSPDMFESAVFDPCPGSARVGEAGVRHKYSVALIRDMVMHWKEAPEDLRHLLSSAEEIYAKPGDLIPGLYQLLSYSQVLDYRRQFGHHKRTDLMAAYFHDICWNGEPID